MLMSEPHSVQLTPVIILLSHGALGEGGERGVERKGGGSNHSTSAS
jgi:hypothetical protein